MDQNPVEYPYNSIWWLVCSVRSCSSRSYSANGDHQAHPRSSRDHSKILPRSRQDLAKIPPRTCQDLAKISQTLPRAWRDVGKILVRGDSHIKGRRCSSEILNYSQTCIKRACIKRSPSIKRSVVKVPKFILSITLNVTSFKRSPLLSRRGHLSRSPREGISTVFTCIKRSVHKSKPYERALNVVILVIKSSYFF